MPNLNGGLGKRCCYREKERECNLCCECTIKVVGDKQIQLKSMRRIMLEPSCGKQKFAQEFEEDCSEEIREKFDINSNVDQWSDDTTVTYKQWKSGNLFEIKKKPYEIIEEMKFKLIPEYTQHAAIKARSRYISIEYQRNMMPHTILLNIDFSENFTYNQHARQTQSAHWHTSQCTLFVCLIQYLDYAKWNDNKSILQKGDEVSFYDNGICSYGEVYKQENNQVYIKRPLEYQIKDKESGRYVNEYVIINRMNVHKRVLIMEPIMTFSDDKCHDTYFVQKFFLDLFFDNEGWFNKQSNHFKNRFKHLLINSDGAASHFKSKFTLQFICKLKLKLIANGYKFNRLTWYFGCPGHGKGTWDGLGGIIKNLLFRMILKEGKVFGSEDKKLLFEWAKLIFVTNPEIENKKYNKISKWNLQWQDAQSTIRPGKTEKGKHIREEIEEIRAFTDIHKPGLGTQELFEYEVVEDANDNYCLLVSRTGCACANYCMKDNLIEFKSCSIEKRATVKVNTLVRKVRQKKQNNPPIANVEEQNITQFEDENHQEEEEEEEEEDSDELQLPEMQRNNHTWGLIDSPRRRGRLKVDYCCCNSCHGTENPKKITNEYERRTRGEKLSCGHIHINCWANGNAAECILCKF